MLATINVIALCIIFTSCMFVILHPTIKMPKGVEFVMFAMCCAIVGVLATNDNRIAWVVFNVAVALVSVVLAYRQLQRSKIGVH